MPPKKSASEIKSKRTQPAETARAKSATKHAAVKKPAAPRAVKSAATAKKIPAAMTPTEEKKKEDSSERYWEGVGRRKTAVARVRFFTRGEKGIWINNKTLADYFQYPNFQRTAAEAIELMNSGDKFRISVKIKGGGTRAQAEAVRHGTARVLVLFNPDFRKRLKRAGFLTRDPRMVERKKFGLKKARRAPQWAKR